LRSLSKDGPVRGRTPRKGRHSRISVAANRGTRLPRRFGKSVTKRVVVSCIAVATIVVAVGAVAAVATGSFNGIDRTFSRMSYFTSLGLGLEVRQIIVDGRDRVSLSELAGALAISKGDSIIQFDPIQARKRILKIDWIEDAYVTRLLPNTIHVEIQERQARALWQVNGKLALIDSSGVILTTKNLERFSKMPLVVGIGAGTRAENILAKLATEPWLFRRFEAAVLVSNRRWNIHLDNGIKVMLPASDVQIAWQRFAELDEVYGLLGQDIELVDLRVPGRLVVRLSKSASLLREDPGEST